MDTSQHSEGENTKKFLGFLKGHGASVTSMVSGNASADNVDAKIFVSGSRDKTILVWKLNPSEDAAEHKQLYGEPYMALKGHSHFVSDLVLSKDNTYLFSSSWDKTMRIWDLKRAKCTETFLGSNKELTSVAVTNDLRKIYTSGLEDGITVWNTKGKRMDASKLESNHGDWISRLCSSPSQKNDYLASVGWDGCLKIWLPGLSLKNTIDAHDGPINALAISNNGMFIATGGRDCCANIWKYPEFGDPVQKIKTDSNVNAIAFNPNFKIYAIATDLSTSVFSLDKDANSAKTVISNRDLDPDRKSKKDNFDKFTSVCWSGDGTVLFCGTSSGLIAVYKINTS